MIFIIHIRLGTGKHLLRPYILNEFIEFLSGWGFVIASLAGALLLYPAWKWWESLGDDSEEE